MNHHLVHPGNFRGDRGQAELLGHAQVKRRQRQRGSAQYEKLAATNRRIEVVEGGGPPVSTGVVNAVVFDFAGVQDDAPLVATSSLNGNLVVTQGLSFGPSTGSRDSFGNHSTNAGNEFNVAGFAFPDSSVLSTAIAGNDYVGFVVTPTVGIEMLLDTVTFDLWRNGTNAAQRYAILTSIDGFGSGDSLGQIFLDESDTSQTAFDVQYTSGQWVTDEVEVRLYGWDANNEVANTHINGVSLTASFRSIAGSTIGTDNG